MTLNGIKSLGASLKARNKIVLMSAAIASTAIVGSAGVAAAQNFNNNDQGPPSIVQRCKEHYKQLGFKNVGQCVSFFEHQQHGYGGDGDNDRDDQGHHDNDGHHHHHHHHWWSDFHFKF